MQQVDHKFTTLLEELLRLDNESKKKTTYWKAGDLILIRKSNVECAIDEVVQREDLHGYI